MVSESTAAQLMSPIGASLGITPESAAFSEPA
jgi:hypothetical protein